jgi:hypothetical protein
MTKPPDDVAMVDVVEPAEVSYPDSAAPEAFHGLAGDVVRTIEPHTESDKMAVLMQLLTAFGNIIGRTAHFRVEADRHHTNLFMTLVAKTSKGRKGTAWSQVRRVMEMVEEGWQQKVSTGLSSGEGLIWAVRDPLYKKQPYKKNGRVAGYDDVMVDEGVDDKRLLVVESEFASTLKVMGREGNTLSPIIRQAWDTGNLSTLVKQSPARSTGALISIIGHITKEELRRNLESTETANGFANRFLWVCATRSKFLPEGGHLAEAALKPLVERLKGAAELARGQGVLRRDRDARDAWATVYPILSEGKPGLLGAVTSRAEAQVVRLSLIYALLDLSTEIRIEHLQAALAVWEYCEASARFIFGASLGDPVADTLLNWLLDSPEGLTRTEIRDLFGRNKNASEIDAALTMLQENGLAASRPISTDGRPATKWFAVRLVGGFGR